MFNFVIASASEAILNRITSNKGLLRRLAAPRNDKPFIHFERNVLE